ncbi:hypothetical protein JQU17_04435 [Ponticoccus sp. SC2-23]|uniref:3-deoxy-D-manno-octulosonic acid transferase n=1 Tax=Alexandriicola marinus TaxID=2081710 RepID=UPI000FD93719|nr:glycosyltransferase N-terminal domain-containing protein [Alexandriicola marinus]MBM1219434.1 hypothetical protein [Ponticoccus sp. SC6-9]MBM1223494.1 hypothetical protein [Ponticoccus sp. SC6-15]MBM1229247.1 hypothetical protein [Ponticoccus sp. SC6-38]MBM1232460.1 hypothetical protein [Ponticoccus sp. SC6-45]MBM1237590.1 hypothetical protein [Ponticoccus sp. SC6-49]MBM1241471.1 hypothetical protein [Ponticoccus sp. SC2-64]MBM1245984.1 hypothetical protein [Ponticoccus sp. SC6-42]MBM125
MSLPWAVRAYLAVTAIAPIVLTRPAARAHARQGAESARWQERLGRPALQRPGGPLIWLQAASVGELTSSIAMASELADETGATLLITTATATGAETASRRMQPGALHQFQPLDTPKAVSRFLDHWRPDLALFVEADLWPRTILACEARGISMALLNARASRSRARAPRVARALLSRMAVITAQSGMVRDALVSLGLDAGRVHAPGDLKADTPLLPCDAASLASLESATDGRPVWAAVSTHPGEEEIVLEAQAHVRDQSPDAILLLVPRHPERGDEIMDAISRSGHSVRRRSTGETPGDASVYLVDTLGETGLVYRLARLALVGGSLLAGPGGHTPFEPAALGTAILHGPHVRNFHDAFQALDTAGAARSVEDAQSLAEAVTDLLASDRAKIMGDAARAYAEAQSGARAATRDLLRPLLGRDTPDAGA